MHKLGRQQIVKVGIIGCGEIAQVVHIPTLTFMHRWFRITYFCDVSRAALEHCAAKLQSTPQTTHDPHELCASGDVDVVLVINSDEYHAAHAIMALQHNKHVLVEKPLALTKRDVQAVIEAEKCSKGKVMVGYMRRYAAPFEDALREIGGMDQILYARIRDIIGPNAAFVEQSGTFPEKFNDITSEVSADREARAKEMISTALEKECGGLTVTPASTLMWRVLGGLGSHDLSVMRDVLGMPERIVGSSLGFPFWNVLFKYPKFTVSYESGIDNIPRFDAHIEVYSSNKTVRIQYDTPYVKGLPITMHVCENVDGVFRESVVRRSYEDAYTLEMKRLWQLVTDNSPVKTTAEDALQDLELFSMIMKHSHVAGGA
ncbi:myo-inositol 2-dehydrogenase [Stagonosporopsis vannaccii]|nr:myo-inositol 2-dehydrogenase [Stagonosporopsis vannaccii]